MKATTLVIGILVCFISFSCKEDVQIQKYEKDGVSFKYPSTWNITEEEELEEGVNYLAVEKKGLLESGILTLTVFDYEEDPENYIFAIQENLDSQNQMKNLIFKDIATSKYNDFDCLKCDYEFSVLGDKHTGTIIAFNKNQKTIGILKQFSIEDTDKSRDGFQIIETSFVMK
ncbi:MAG: hypothetical protein ACK4UK_03840 [Flavobacterium sp.]